jgi:hypothetical protein
MDKERREELHRQLEEDKITAKANIAQLMQEELIDEDGYPTEAALTIVRIWHWSDSKGWFEFIKSIWHLASWGWSEGETDHDYRKDEKVYQYHISTAGWSGNEAIIREMEQNSMMWHFNWVQSRRGGHYIFELKDFDE